MPDAVEQVDQEPQPRFALNWRPTAGEEEGGIAGVYLLSVGRAPPPAAGGSPPAPCPLPGDALLLVHWCPASAESSLDGLAIAPFHYHHEPKPLSSSGADASTPRHLEGHEEEAIDHGWTMARDRNSQTTLLFTPCPERPLKLGSIPVGWLDPWTLRVSLGLRRLMPSRRDAPCLPLAAQLRIRDGHRSGCALQAELLLPGAPEGEQQVYQTTLPLGHVIHSLRLVGNEAPPPHQGPWAGLHELAWTADAPLAELHLWCTTCIAGLPERPPIGSSAVLYHLSSEPRHAGPTTDAPAHAQKWWTQLYLSITPKTMRIHTNSLVTLGLLKRELTRLARERRVGGVHVQFRLALPGLAGTAGGESNCMRAELSHLLGQVHDLQVCEHERKLRAGLQAWMRRAPLPVDRLPCAPYAALARGPVPQRHHDAQGAVQHALAELQQFGEMHAHFSGRALDAAWEAARSHLITPGPPVDLDPALVTFSQVLWPAASPPPAALS